MATDIA